MVMKLKGSSLPLSVAATLLAWGCAGEPLAVERDRSAPIETSELSYELEDQPYGVGTRIPFSFTNRMGRTIYLMHCSTRFAEGPEEIALAMVLEGQDGDGWEPVWGPVLPACFSPPLVLDPGEEMRDTLFVHSLTHEWSPLERLSKLPRAGVYRLSWSGWFLSYDERTRKASDPLPPGMSRSNEFVLVRK